MARTLIQAPRRRGALAKQAARPLASLLLALSLIGAVGLAHPLVVQATPAPESVAATYYAINSAVRAPGPMGLDLVVQGVEVSQESLVVRLLLANHTGHSVAVAVGPGAEQARLTGLAKPVAPIAVSDSLKGGPIEKRVWPDGAVIWGSITFPVPTTTDGVTVTDGLALEWRPYPAVPLSLSTPGEAVKLPEPVAVGDYTPEGEVEVLSAEIPGTVLRITGATVSEEELTLQVTVANEGSAIISGTEASLAGAQLLDGAWQAVTPHWVDEGLKKGLLPGGKRWLPEATLSGAYVFLRPLGPTLTLRMPYFPSLDFELADGAIRLLPSRPQAPAAPVEADTTSDAPAVVDPAAQAAALAAEVDALLERQAQAVLNKDRDAFLATFDRYLQIEAGDVFDRLTNLPITSYTLERTSRQVMRQNDKVNNLPVDLRFTFDGINPNNVFTLQRQIDLIHDEDGWKVMAQRGDQAFWDLGSVSQRSSDHFLILYRPAAEKVIETVVKEAEAAYADLNRRMPGVLEPRYVLYLTADPKEFTTLSRRPAATVAGVAVWQELPTAKGARIYSSAMIINGAAFKEAAAGRQRTIQHELTHLALAPITRAYTPAWLVEGAAMYFTDDFRWEALGKGALDTVSLAALMEKPDFITYDPAGTQMQADYTFSAAVVKLMIERRGQEAFLNFFRSYTDIPVDDVLDRYPTMGGQAAARRAMLEFGRRVTEELVRAQYHMQTDHLTAATKEMLGPLIAEAMAKAPTPGALFGPAATPAPAPTPDPNKK